jgi:hypothetical protein
MLAAEAADATTENEEEDREEEGEDAATKKAGAGSPLLPIKQVTPRW